MFLIAALSVAGLGCQPDEPACVPGDQTACRCGDGTFGYRTCSMAVDATEFSYGACDCVIGLSPDSGTLASPYTSGRGTGSGTQDAGGP